MMQQVLAPGARLDHVDPFTGFSRVPARRGAYLDHQAECDPQAEPVELSGHALCPFFAQGMIDLAAESVERE